MCEYVCVHVCDLIFFPLFEIEVKFKCCACMSMFALDRHSMFMRQVDSSVYVISER